MFLNGTFTIVAFSGVLWSISRAVPRSASPTRRSARCSRIVLGRPLVPLNYDQSDREADFRAELVHLRENAESVALLHREPRLRDPAPGADRRPGRATCERIIAVNRNLGFFTTGYNYLIQIIPALIVAPLFIRGAGRVRRDHAVGDGVLAPARRVLADRHAVPADLVLRRGAGAAERARRRLAADGKGDADRDRRVRRGARVPAALAARDPRRARAGRDLSAPPPGHAAAGPRPGQRLIALFRATADLWDSGEGRIVRPPSDTSSS